MRYFGDLAAVVTFRETDPLYLIDLSDKPRVLGELKVPGYSTYLHPIGDGLLLAVGMDGGENGRRELQASVFDVTDPSRPRSSTGYALGHGDSRGARTTRARSPTTRRDACCCSRSPTGTAAPSEVQAIRVAARREARARRHDAVSDERQERTASSRVERVLIDAQNFYAVQSATHRRGRPRHPAPHELIRAAARVSSGRGAAPGLVVTSR